MNRFLAQIAAVAVMNLRNLPARAAASIVTLIGIAGVVGVFTGVLAVREGLRQVLEYSGAADVAIVLSGGAGDEMVSLLTQEQTRIIRDAPNVMRVEGEALASGELYIVVDVPLRATNTPASVPLRGVSPQARKLRGAFKIIAGRDLRPGTFELIVGRGAALQYTGLDVGQQIRLGRFNWTVVGVFEDDGSSAESEIWADVAVLQGGSNRDVASVRVKLAGASAMQGFKDALTQDPRLNVRVFSEQQYYREQSRVLVQLVTVVGNGLAFLMAIGATFAALNTMYSSVAARTREIATLRAVGFGRLPVVISVLVEAMVLSLIGGVIGGFVSWIAVDGIRTATLNPATFSQLTFAYRVTPELLVQGLVYAMFLGLIGGLFPGVRAARVSITTGLREV